MSKRKLLDFIFQTVPNVRRVNPKNEHLASVSSTITSGAFSKLSRNNKQDLNKDTPSKLTEIDLTDALETENGANDDFDIHDINGETEKMRHTDTEESVLREILREIWGQPDDNTNDTRALGVQRKIINRSPSVTATSLPNKDRYNNTRNPVAGQRDDHSEDVPGQINRITSRPVSISRSTVSLVCDDDDQLMSRNNRVRSQLNSTAPGRNSTALRPIIDVGDDDGFMIRNNGARSRRGNTHNLTARGRNSTAARSIEVEDDDEFIIRNNRAPSRRGNTHISTTRGRNCTAVRSISDEDDGELTVRRDRSNLRNVSSSNQIFKRYPRNRCSLHRLMSFENIFSFTNLYYCHFTKFPQFFYSIA